MICKRCGVEFFEDYRKDKKSRLSPPAFCSRSCANSRAFSEETNNKKSTAGKKYWEHNRPTIIEKYRDNGKNGRRLSATDRLKGRKANSLKYLERNLHYLSLGQYENLSSPFRKKQILKEANYSCESCKRSEWLGKPIPLEIHHKDNNTKNNVRSNLQVLCLNCHYFTPKYRFRNRSSKPQA